MEQSCHHGDDHRGFFSTHPGTQKASYAANAVPPARIIESTSIVISRLKILPGTCTQPRQITVPAETTKRINGWRPAAFQYTGCIWAPDQTCTLACNQDNKGGWIYVIPPEGPDLQDSGSSQSNPWCLLTANLCGGCTSCCIPFAITGKTSLLPCNHKKHSRADMYSKGIRNPICTCVLNGSAKYPSNKRTIALPHRPIIRIDPPILWTGRGHPAQAANADHINELESPSNTYPDW